MFEDLIQRARRASEEFLEHATQTSIDAALKAIAHLAFEGDVASRLAAMEASESGMGSAEDKARKTRDRVFGLVHQLIGVPSIGIIRDDPELGITEYAKPKGVVGAFVPSTATVPNVLQNTLMILKGGNAVIFSPQPRTAATAVACCELVRERLVELNLPADLVQCVPSPTRESRDALMREVDVVLAIGGANLIRHANASGRPTIGGGVGNAVVVVHATADVPRAAEMIARGKTFDHATSCSAESSLVVARSVAGAMLEALATQGGHVLSAEEKERVERAMWPEGRLNVKLLCRPAGEIAEHAGLSGNATAARFFVGREEGVGPAFPWSGEKLSVLLAFYVYDDFSEALDLVRRILRHQGAGHSCGIHASDPSAIDRLARTAEVGRVLVDQCHGASNSGSFQNGLPFTPAVGCGSWGGNNLDENITWRHFINVTRLARPIERPTPDAAAFFEDVRAWRAARG